MLSRFISSIYQTSVYSLTLINTCPFKSTSPDPKLHDWKMQLTFLRSIRTSRGYIDWNR
uniref:Uncharacterized protein n=1 Tax=Triticum urartu TaxID=4572 RepID=A0A8R7QWG1_TRIUA